MLAYKKTILLRAVDTSSLYSKYMKDEYLNREIPEEKIALKSTRLNTNLSMLNDPDITTFRDRSNKIVSIIHMNNKTEDLQCGWCGAKIKDEPVGIPISMTISRNEEGEEEIIIFIDDCHFHSFECAYSGLRMYRGYTADDKDSYYCDSEQLMRYLWNLMYPGETLREAQDRRLFTRYGGKLKEAEANHKYIRVSNIHIQSVKSKYIRI